MPRFPAHRFIGASPDNAPPYAPWRSKDDPDRNLVWERRVSDGHLRTLQQIAYCCGVWAPWHKKCGSQSLMLAASTLSIEQLASFLDSVTGWMLDFSSGPAKRKIPIRNKKGADDTRARLLALLEAVHVIRAVVAGQEDFDVFWEDDPEVDIPEFSIGWRDGDAIEYGYVARALRDDFAYVTSEVRGLPSETLLTGRLRDAAHQAYRDLNERVRKAAAGSPTAAPKERKVVARAMDDLRNMVTAKNTTWVQWCKATETVRAAVDAWTQQPWIGGLGHESNQFVENQLHSTVACLRQHALLMRAADRRHRMLLRLEALLALAREAGKCATKIIGAYNAPPPREMSKLFKVDLVEPACRRQWVDVLGSIGRKAERVIAIVLKERQRTPWLIGEHMESFVRKGLVGGEDADTQRRSLVNEVLVPMQMVGLAAKVRWSDLLAVPPTKTSKTKKRGEPDRAAKMSKGYRGRLWVVNPFGLRLRID